MGKEYDFKSFFAKESPFHDEYVKDYTGNKPNLPTFRINKYMLEDLENHFKKSNMTWTDGMTQMIHEYLDRICLERRTFNHLEVIMLIPKSDSIDEMESKSKIIAYINSNTDFKEYYEHKAFEGEYNILFELMPFDELNFPMNILRETKDSCVINTSKEDCESFEKFKDSQKELYDDIDLDDCYFVRFPLNNYLDVKNENGYAHGLFNMEHLGLYVFHDPIVRLNNPDDELKINCLIDWHYLADISKIEFDYTFPKGNIIDWIYGRVDDADESIEIINAIKSA